MAGFATLVMVDLECADPPVLAEFYHQVLGWEVIHSQADYAVIGAGSTRIRLGRVDGYQGRPGTRSACAPPRLASDRIFC
jgi:catechol-2,3-dioxygenase